MSIRFDAVFRLLFVLATIGLSLVITVGLALLLTVPLAVIFRLLVPTHQEAAA
jgi:hypothetical protein